MKLKSKEVLKSAPDMKNQNSSMVKQVLSNSKLRVVSKLICIEKPAHKWALLKAYCKNK